MIRSHSVQGTVILAPSSSGAESQAPTNDSRSALGPHDVLLGRGLGITRNVGNVMFRELVNEHKMRYVACFKTDKPKIAKELVHYWHSLDPPGRFLARDVECKKNSPNILHGGRWCEVGDKIAQQKASQCLRERTPDVTPYCNYMRACKKEQKAQALAAEILEMRNSAEPLTVEYLREVEREMQENSIAVPTDIRLKQQIQQRQEANPLLLALFRANPTSSSPHQTSQVMSSLPKISHRGIPVQLFLQQREAAAQMRTYQAVEMEYLLQVKSEQEERDLADQILLRNRASMMLSTLGSSTIPANVPVYRYRRVATDVIWRREDPGTR
jgi:hypothetical protein